LKTDKWLLDPIDSKKPPIDFIAQGKSEQVGVLVALAFGAFTVIMLMKDVNELSFGWYILTAIYWFIFIAGIQVFVNLCLQILIINQYLRKHYDEYDDDIEQFIKNYGIFKKFYYVFWKDPEDKKLYANTWVHLAILSLLALLLWISVGLDQTLGMNSFDGI
jgi:hypothetical protein